jgi:hypothetical protein
MTGECKGQCTGPCRLTKASICEGTCSDFGSPSPEQPGVEVQRSYLTPNYGCTIPVLALPSVFWPIVVGACIVPWLPLPGRPATDAALLLPVVLIATT